MLRGLASYQIGATNNIDDTPGHNRQLAAVLPTKFLSSISRFRFRFKTLTDQNDHVLPVPMK